MVFQFLGAGVSFFNGSCDDCVDTVTQCRKIVFPQIFCFDHIVQMHGDCARPDQPARFLIELERANDADGNNGRPELQCHAEHSVLERADAAIERSLPFGEYREAYA